MRITRRGKIAALVGVAVIIALQALYLRSIGVLSSSDPGKEVEVVIPSGANVSTIGEILEEKEVIPSALGFRVAAYLDGGGDGLQAGKYELSRGLNARDALDAVREGPVVEFVQVTFPEGSWLTDFAEVLDDKTDISESDFLDVVNGGEIRSEYQPDSVSSLEGLLFPSTYQVVERDDAESVARRLVREFEERVSGLDLAATEELGVTTYEAIIVASMVEAEAKAPEERPMIARVIYNRLEAGIPLGIDATVNYALGTHKLDLSASELAVDSPYNTRKVTGLPPTPIGAPGLASLEAALVPAPGEWLYYVLEDCEGHHAFSESYQEFLSNKARYQGLDC